MAYELANNSSLSANISFNVQVSGWIIVGTYNRRSERRAYKVKQISGTMYLSREGKGLAVAPSITISGNWSNSTGHKWSERDYYWNWGNEQIQFHDLPNSIKDYIYGIVEEKSREFLLNLHSGYKELTANRGFTQVEKEEKVDEEQTFMPTVKIVAGPCKWENMDVSEWAIARKELGLPKPARKPRKKKVVV